MILSNNRKTPQNPYIIGRSIHEKELFFGRDNLFNFIDANLNKDAKVILLHGQRRIGKSSVLYQIPNFVGGDKFVFVYFDLQDKANLELAEVLEKLAEEIIKKLKLNKDNIRVPLKAELEANTKIFSEKFLPQVFENLDGKNLVLLLDEFDVLSNYNPASAIEHFFPYLKSIISNHQQLFIIPVIGRRLDDMKNLLNLFPGVPNQEIGLLDKKSATQLITQSRDEITQPAEGVLKYQPDAIPAILELSAGHPYFTQVICFQIFQQAEAEEEWQVTSADVNEMVVDRSIESAEGGLTWFRDGLPIPEQVIFSAVAEAQKIAAIKRSQVVKEPLTLLKEYGVVLTKSLLEAPDRLVKWGFLDNVESSESPVEKIPRYKVTVELVRRWLLKKYSLRSEILELGNLNLNSIRIWELRLRNNPNDFQALFKLAEKCLKRENFGKAVKFYQRGYKVNPIQAEDGLLESLLGYGQKLMEQKKWEVAKEKFEEVLKLDPDNKLAQDKLRKIEKFMQINRNPFTVSIMTGVLAVPLLIGIGIWGGLQIRENQLIREKFSSGDKILFEKANNKNYNDEFSRCNQKFQSKDESAANCFEELVKANDNEPEPLIYYNNSLARSHDNPLSIAVVVPADTSSGRAKEILRGVAQAQNEYNQSQNKNTRLLEVIIANDSNDEEISPKVAQAIVKNQDILGVIGHNSSNATEAALEVYEKGKLAVISSTSTSTELNSDVFFRTIIDNSAMSKKLAEYVQSLPIKKTVIFYNKDSSFSKSLEGFFDFYLNNFKPSIEVRSIDLRQPFFDLNKEIQAAKDNQVEVGMLFSDLGKIDLAISIAKANYELPENQRLKLFGGDSLYNCDTLNKGKQAVKGFILAVPWFKKLPTAKPFVDKARTQWGGEVSWRTATSYDATKAFIDALSNSGDNPTRPKVLEKLKEVNLPPEETSGQNLKFNPEGETTGEAILVEVVEDSSNSSCSGLNFRRVEE